MTKIVIGFFIQVHSFFEIQGATKFYHLLTCTYVFHIEDPVSL